MGMRSGFMNIGIIGGGSLGLLFSGYLRKHFNITLFVRRQEQKRHLLNQGVTVHKDDHSFTNTIQVTDDFHHLNEQQCIFIAVKQYDLSKILQILASIPVHIPLVFLQNGMGHLKLLDELPHKHIFVATVEHGAYKIDDCNVQHNGIGKTNIAEYRGSSNRIAALLQVKERAFLFSWQPNYEKMMLRKLMVNAMINPLTALLGVKNGQLVTNAHYKQVFLSIYDEMISLFPQMEGENVKEIAISICTNTKDNYSSMLRDIQNKQQTEIDSILGYLVEEATVKKKELPTIQLLNELVKGMELERMVK